MTPRHLQSARDAKTRKAKSRAKAAAEHRSWIDREKVKPRSHPTSLLGLLGREDRLIRNLMSSPDLADRLFADREQRIREIMALGIGCALGADFSPDTPNTSDGEER